MNRSVRKVALALGIAFAALFAQLNYDQVFASKRFAQHPANRRLLVKEYSTRRGEIILAGTNAVIARSQATEDSLKYQRVYPLGSLFGEITGYYSVVYGASAVERAFNDYLIGKQPTRAQTFVDELLGREPKGNSIVLTLDRELQRIAQEKLRGQKGAVAAIDPATGEVLALYSNPTFDPNPLSVHSISAVNKTWNALENDRSHPLIARATRERYPPGSTFKVVVAAAALAAGIEPGDRFNNPTSVALPLSNRRLSNYNGRACPGSTFNDALRFSCNTIFAQIGQRIGAAKLVAMARKFGLQDELEFDLPLAASCIRTAPAGCAEPNLDAPQTMLSSIGQFDVRTTPLQMAVVAATVANMGRRPTPHVVKEIRSFEGAVVERFSPPPSAPIYPAEAAEAMKAMMINVVERGTGTRAQISGYDKQIGGKTGTAQTGVDDEDPHVWFISFAPGIAVAVVVENGGDAGGDATGGRVCAPIAKALMENWLKRRAG